jgi:hypothetical protein
MSLPPRDDQPQDTVEWNMAIPGGRRAPSAMSGDHHQAELVRQ